MVKQLQQEQGSSFTNQVQVDCKKNQSCATPCGPSKTSGKSSTDHGIGQIALNECVPGPWRRH